MRELALIAMVWLCGCGPSHLTGRPVPLAAFEAPQVWAPAQATVIRQPSFSPIPAVPLADTSRFMPAAPSPRPQFIPYSGALMPGISPRGFVR